MLKEKNFVQKDYWLSIGIIVGMVSVAILFNFIKIIKDWAYLIWT